MFKKLIEKRKEKRRIAYENELMRRTGLRFSSEIVASSDSFPWAKYIVNALALFGAVFGSLYTVITGFNLKLNTIILFGVCVILSFVMSFMYTNDKVKILLYVLFLLLSMFLVAGYYIRINSGVSAFHNLTMTAIDNVMELDQIREYMEYYDNRYVSLTFAFSIVALAMMILLNIAISEYMNFWVVFFLTFPIVQYGMFFGFESSKFGMISVIGSWLLVASVSYTNSYNGLNNKLKSEASVKKHLHRYGFITDSNNVSRIALYMLVFIISVTTLMMLVVPQDSFEMSSPINRLKTRANDTVNKVLSYGIASILPFEMNRLNSGELSNQSYIRYDGQTDLKVTLVDYGEDRMYLRNYIGTNYEPFGFRWDNHFLKNLDSYKDDEGVMRSLSDDSGFTASLLEYDYNNEQIMSNTKHKIRIQVLDKAAAGNESMFIPYFAVLDDEYKRNSVGLVIPKNENKIYDSTLTFYTIDNKNTDVNDIYYNGSTLNNRELFSESDNIYQHLEGMGYYEVPKANVDVIDEFLEKYNIHSTDENVVNEVINALTENYDYTLRPGSVPRDEDYVNYFLKSNKKGYCMHFASSATLIFRRLGIAARYVEGYVVDRENFEYSKEEEGIAYSDYISGDAYEGSTVQTISLPDSNGHAWVELYSPGLGWQPVEVTQAASIDSYDNQGVLSRIFGADSQASATADDIINQVKDLDVETTKKRVIAFFGIVLIILIIVYLFRLISARIRQMIKYNAGDYKTSIGYRISDLIEIFTYRNENEVLSYEEFSDILLSKSYISDADKKLYDNELEKAMFAKGDISDTTYHDLVGVINRSRKLIIANMTFKNKIKLYLVDFKW